jgi:hypothetical protein
MRCNEATVLSKYDSIETSEQCGRDMRPGAQQALR